MVIEKWPTPFLPPASTTSRVNAYVPAVVGVPEITPVPVARVSPGGRLPLAMVQVTGLVAPVTSMSVLYAVPTVPFGVAPVKVNWHRLPPPPAPERIGGHRAPTREGS